MLLGLRELECIVKLIFKLIRTGDSALPCERCVSSFKEFEFVLCTVFRFQTKHFFVPSRWIKAIRVCQVVINVFFKFASVRVVYKTKKAEMQSLASFTNTYGTKWVTDCLDFLAVCFFLKKPLKRMNFLLIFYYILPVHMTNYSAVFSLKIINYSLNILIIRTLKRPFESSVNYNEIPY